MINNHGWSRALEILTNNLSSIKTDVSRLKLLKVKYDIQQKHLKSMKNSITTSLKSDLESLQISYFATITEITHLENILNPWKENEKLMKELVNVREKDINVELTLETCYRFQMHIINSRLSRREQDIPDERVKNDFTPDKWQVDFLNADDEKTSIIIPAPTASGNCNSMHFDLFIREDDFLK
ncbi:unnamed protein product [Didymodactylos carnosus]|uniref:Uncharacterized protein n=1 Tax=Didymodactylos carnosus TaxID=1234261 RepID=A0A815Z1R8_9BILA|nr:unnamed protein product [Didymodactylos carnosus]CAF4444924.1 unnamed protein product [Didymodactylos carnosus]